MDATVDASPDPAPLAHPESRTAARAAARGAVAAGLGLLLADPYAPLLLGPAAAATAFLDQTFLLSSTGSWTSR